MKKAIIGALGAAAFITGIGLGALPSTAADHLEAPLVQQDGRTDINDVYAFRSPESTDNTVLVLTVNPAAGILSPTTFSPDATYRFQIDTDGDAKQEETIKVKFGPVDEDGSQTMKVLGPVAGDGRTGTEVALDGGARAYAGTFDDPFFFDFQAFQDQVKGAGGTRTFCDAHAVDFFAGLNVSAIVIEVPTERLTGNESTIGDFCNSYNLRPMQVYASIKLLSQSGYLIANEGLNAPSRAMFTLDKGELYRFEIANKRLEPYIKTLLRTYGGIMHNYSNIYEEELARNLRCPVQYVVNALTVLSRQNVVDYIPRRDKPFITFLRPRVAAERLLLDKQLFEFRKKTQRNNIESVISYTETDALCRSRQLVGWFGETDSPDCGMCDVCLAKKRKANENERFKKIAAEVKTTLNQQSASIEQLVEAIPNFPSEELIKVVRWMLDNGQLLVDKDRRYSVV